MILKAKNATKYSEETPMDGKGIVHFDNLNHFTPPAENLITFSIATLGKGSEVGYHLHDEDIEIYYILSGKAVYNDDGEEACLSAGDVTYTPVGSSHAIKNVEDEDLVFMVIILKP